MDNRILDKLDKIDERLDTMNVTLAQQETNIALHIKRTNLLEEKLEKQEADRIRPLELKVYMVQGVITFLGLLGIVGGIYEAFFK